MILQWYGHACFKISGNQTDAIVVIDPFDASVGPKLPRLSGNILIQTKDSPEFNNLEAVKGVSSARPFIITHPGEYEVSGVCVSAVLAEKKQESKKGKPERTILVSVGLDDLSVCHLSDIDRPLSERELDALGRIDILLLPVGGGATLPPKGAVEVLNQIDPRIVIPMLYNIPGFKKDLGAIDAFLKEYGLKNPEKEDKFKILKRDLPSEETKVILLNSV